MIGLRPARPPMDTHAEVLSSMPQPDESSAASARRVAFQRLTDQRLARAYRLATLVLRDATEAEDAVPDAAVLAWTRFDELRDRDRFVVNACRQRRRGPQVRTLPMPASHEIPQPDGASDRAEREALRRALDRLTPEHRAVVVLRHLEGHSISEIALRTGEREGTIKSRLHYALQALRAAYDAAER